MATDYENKLKRIKVMMTVVVVTSVVVGIIALILLKPAVIDQPIEEAIRQIDQDPNMSQADKDAARTYMMKVSQLLLPIVIPLCLLLSAVPLCAIWFEWLCWIIFMSVMCGLDAVSQMVFGIMTNVPHVLVIVLMDLIMAWGYWRLAGLIRKKRREPHLFNESAMQHTLQVPVQTVYGYAKGGDYTIMAP